MYSFMSTASGQGRCDGLELARAVREASTDQVLIKGSRYEGSCEEYRGERSQAALRSAQESLQGLRWSVYLQPITRPLDVFDNLDRASIRGLEIQDPVVGVQLIAERD
jgi:hypothetical protein